LDMYGQTPETMLAYGARLRDIIWRSTGIPVSVGIAATKTLAKLANHIAKRRTAANVYFLHPDDPILRDISVSEVWGAGPAYTRRLAAAGVKVVSELQALRPQWMRREFGVVGQRLLQELQGLPCLELEPPVTGRQHTMVSRSFRRLVNKEEEMYEAVATYTSRLAEKLRRYHQVAATLTVFIWTNKYERGEYAGRTCYSLTAELPMATHDTGALIREAGVLLRRLYQPSLSYKKAGVLAGELRPAGAVQGNLFLPDPQTERKSSLLQAVDQLNRRYGRRTVQYAACGTRPAWSLKAEKRSPRYTTRLEEILVV